MNENWTVEKYITRRLAVNRPISQQRIDLAN